MEVSQRAKKSGMGDLSDAMSWILCGPPVDLISSKSRGTELRKNSSPLATEYSGTPPDTLDFSVYDDSSDYGDCELEWDSWAKDLARQARVNASKHFAVTVTESLAAHYHHGRDRFGGHSASSSPVSTPPLSEQVTPTSSSPLPRHHRHHRPIDILHGVNMDLLSVDSPALLTAPSVLPFQSTGVTTSTVSAGGIVRTRSLISNDCGRGRGVARAMEVLSEVGSGSRHSGMGRHRTAGKQRRTREEHNAHSALSPARSTTMPSPAGTITSTVTIREAGALSPTQPYVSHLADAPPGVAVTGHAALETISTTTTTTIQLLPTTTTTTTTRRLNNNGTEGAAAVPASGRGGGGDKAGKGKLLKGSSSRGKAFSPERLVSKLDSALDFVTG
jgi:hypothetical protein